MNEPTIRKKREKMTFQYAAGVDSVIDNPVNELYVQSQSNKLVLKANSAKKPFLCPFVGGIGNLSDIVSLRQIKH